MARMLKKTKRLGRCTVCGHGCNCEVAREIQSVQWTRTMDTYNGHVQWTRTMDKRRWKSELEDELNDLVDEWHEGSSDRPLSEYLGMSQQEYALWVEGKENEKTS